LKQDWGLSLGEQVMQDYSWENNINDCISSMYMNAEDRIKDFQKKLWGIGNHEACGIFKETFKDRYNELLLESNEILQLENLDLDKRVEIMCWQFWIVGNMSGRNLKVKEENKISCKLPLRV